VGRLFRSDSGQDLVEYTLLLAVVVLGCILLFSEARTSLSGIWNRAHSTMQGGSSHAGGERERER
jgi:Flp pilus assembly pilin Flp